jgi:hypothetical protein
MSTRRVSIDLDIICVHGRNNITWKANFPMRSVYLIGDSCLTCVETLLVRINISPTLLKEPPDRNELTCVEALGDEGSCGCKPTIS